MRAPTLQQVRVWAANADSLSVAAARIDTAVDDFDHEMNTLTRDVDAAREMWRGDAARASEAATYSERQFGSRLGIAILDIADAINRLSPAFARACRTALETAESIRSLGYVVDTDGTVRPPATADGDLPRDLPSTATVDDAIRRAADHQHRVTRVLAEVGVADSDLADHIGRAVDLLGVASRRATTRVDVRPEVRAILEHRRALPRNPHELNRFWDSLTGVEKAELWNDDRSIGNLDGIPAADRDHFNRRHLAELQRHERAVVATYLDTHPWIVNGQIRPSPGPGGYIADTRRRNEYDAVTRNDRALSGLEKALEDPTGANPRLLLHLDARGTVAVAVNNPDTARNVATLVPGTGATVGTVSGGITRAQTMVAAAHRADPTAPTSVIAWYAYDAPASLAAAAGPAPAAHAAAPLDAFQLGLRATHDGEVPSHNTVVGHSYGTVVVGEAASEGHILDADDLVFVASPGIGGPDSPDDLRLSRVAPADMDEHVYATTAAHDPIGLTEGVHGISPADPDFGGRVFTSDPGSPLSGAAHSQYWETDSHGRMNPALIAMGMIIAGRGDDVR